MTGRTLLGPMSAEDMRRLWRAGDPLAAIASKAYRLNRIGRARVRAIIFDGAEL